MTVPKNTDPQFKLRIPAELLEKLAQSANTNSRSINAEINSRLAGDQRSLRDWFAGQALAGLCGNPGGPFQTNSMTGWGIVNCDVCAVAAEAYGLADAMLAERAKGDRP